MLVSHACRPLIVVVALLLAAAVPLRAQTSAPAGFYYQVQPGDSFDVIARRFRVTAYDIARHNGRSPNDQLAAGSRIWVPGVAAPRAPVVTTTPTPVPRLQTTPAPTPRPSQAPAASGGTVVVRPGDSLWRIASANGVTVADLAAANRISPSASLQVGQTLRLPGGGEPPPREVAAAPSPRATPTPTPRPGGTPRPTATPAARTTSSSSPNVASGAVSARGFSWPVQGTILRKYENSLTSKHSGLDIEVPVGTAVRAARDGVVIYAGESISAYGKMVIVRHDNDLATCYAFNSRNLVRVDQRVKRGEKIAESGDGGRGGRPYLYFQLRRKGEAVDPMPYLP
ncbi:MAG: peptidoglycan DD-metalloendopeptidase family protein [Candidatus Sumerlaeia bacterium]|nr:peptidoglycan DD-metalloendopeptidase family protein [Candidatus Sumerlaeia bacterium]